VFPLQQAKEIVLTDEILSKVIELCEQRCQRRLTNTHISGQKNDSEEKIWREDWQE
jgi:hypothetical protein